MAPAADYLFLSIETLINTVSIIVMIPCMMTLVKTQGMHGNCKILLVTSGTVQTLILFVQCALFVYDFAIENLIHYGPKEFGFHYAQNALFAISTYISMVLVLERTFAVWNAAKYETRNHHILPLCIMLSGSLAFAFFIVYGNFFLYISDKTIYVFYVFEGFTFLISIVIIVYARHKLRHMPFDEDRLKAKYQITEVLKFSVAILPSVILSVFMHTFSLVPTFLWQHELLTWPECCVIYFSVHSLNCIVTKAALIACHAGMRHRFKLIFVAKIRTPKGARITRNVEQEGKDYFSQLKSSWDAAPIG